MPRSDVPSSQQQDWYCVCLECTAKVYSRTPIGRCPRCGTDQIRAVRAGRPWLEHSGQTATGSTLPEYPANTALEGKEGEPSSVDDNVPIVAKPRAD